MQDQTTGKRVLIIVQNLPLPGDRRVWLECKALRDAGYRVATISPAGKGDPRYVEHEGVHLYHYKPPRVAEGLLGFVWEFIYCWVRTFFLSLEIRRKHGFDVIQACNPPDTFFALAALYRPFGVKFVYDQHDLCPEVYWSRFPTHNRLVSRGLLTLERATYALADQVIVTNESYRATALGRGRCRPADVTIVRTGPDPDWMQAGPPHPELRDGKKYLAMFLGVMGPQDGVDVVIDAVEHVVKDLGRGDIHFAILGGGDMWPAMRALVDQKGLSDFVTMPGRVSDEDYFAFASSATVGLSPDPPNPLNDVSTMNKTMEYMAFGLPVLAFALQETRVSAGPAAHYVEQATPTAYGDALVELIDDEARRTPMGEVGRARVVDQLAWRHQAPAYVGVYDRICGGPGERRPAPGEPSVRV